MPAIRTALRQTARTLGFGVMTLGTGACMYKLVGDAPEAENPIVRDKWSNGWARAHLRLFDIRLVVSGSSVRDPRRGRVVVANHRSIIDIAVMHTQFGGCIVARGGIEKWPLVGPAIAARGTIFVDRGDKKSGSNAIAKMTEHLEKHESISLFPEGTTFEDDLVRPFRAGGFVAAQRSGSVVTPVGIAYPEGSGAAYGGETFLAHLTRLAASQGTVVHVEIGEPMVALAGEPIEAFTERGRAEVQRLLDRGHRAP